MSEGEHSGVENSPARPFFDRHRTPLAAVAVAGIALYLAATRTWPFNENPPAMGQDPSLWDLLLAEQVTLGFVRLALAGGCLFLLASMGVLIANNRWIVKLSTTEVTTEELDAARSTIRKYEEQVEELTKERDEYRSLVEYRDMVEMETAPDG